MMGWRINNKGDAQKYTIRARLIARQSKKKGWVSIFSATPPLGAFRYLCSRNVTRRRKPDAKPRKILILDSVRAF